MVSYLRLFWTPSVNNVTNFGRSVPITVIFSNFLLGGQSDASESETIHRKVSVISRELLGCERERQSTSSREMTDAML